MMDQGQSFSSFFFFFLYLRRRVTDRTAPNPLTDLHDERVDGRGGDDARAALEAVVVVDHAGVSVVGLLQPLDEPSLELRELRRRRHFPSAEVALR